MERVSQIIAIRKSGTIGQRKKENSPKSDNQTRQNGAAVTLIETAIRFRPLLFGAPPGLQGSAQANQSTIPKSAITVFPATCQVVGANPGMNRRGEAQIQTR